MDNLMSIIWTGDPIESTFRFLIVVMILELFAVVCAYLGGGRK